MDARHCGPAPGVGSPSHAHRLRNDVLAGALGLGLQSLGGALRQMLLHLALDRAPQEQPRDPSGVRAQRVGGAGASLAQILQFPVADEPLEVALLLLPGETARRVLVEAQDRPRLLDHRVRDRLDQPGPAFLVALQHLDVLQRALPPGSALYVGGDLVAALARRVDLDRAARLEHSTAQTLTHADRREGQVPRVVPARLTCAGRAVLPRCGSELRVQASVSAHRCSSELFLGRAVA